MTRFRVAAATILTVLLIAGAAAAPAAADSIDPEISQALNAVPGGKAVDSRTAVWPELGMTLTVSDPRLRDAVGTCARGSVCAYRGTGLTGAKLSWTTCTTHSLAALGGSARSIADARSTGHLDARNGTAIVATAVAQSWNNVTATNTNIRCVL